MGKDPDAEKDWRQEDKEATEDEMVRWHHWLNGHESEQTPDIVENREASRAVVHGVTKSHDLTTKQQPPPPRIRSAFLVMPSHNWFN